MELSTGSGSTEDLGDTEVGLQVSLTFQNRIFFWKDQRKQWGTRPIRIELAIRKNPKETKKSKNRHLDIISRSPGNRV